MKDPYEKAWDSITKVFNTFIDMIVWIAQRTLTAKEFQEFLDEFNEKSEHD